LVHPVLIEAEVAANLLEQRTADLGAELWSIAPDILADIFEEEDDLWLALGPSLAPG
jgi:hypothetical protein